MNHPWRQPIRPLEVQPISIDENDRWYPVLFIRPGTDGGWEVITRNGVVWDSDDALIRDGI